MRRGPAGLIWAACAAAFVLLAAAPAALGAQEAFVRVDQAGYPSGAPKRAYLMSNFDETGVPYAVLDSGGGTVASGTVGASRGSWSKSFPYVYAIDFDAVTASGRYTVSFAGPAPASSPPFEVAPAASLYSTPLANALSFYEDERDGPEYIPSALRTAPGHLDDEHATTYATPKVNANGQFKGELQPLGKTIDASGGWWDAGDYLKFVETTSYTVSLLEAAVRDFPDQLGSGAPAASDFRAESRFGVEWLLRMWDEGTSTLYYQVGIGEGNSSTVGDHDIWRLPQADDTWGGSNPADRYIRDRPVFRAGRPGSQISPNIAGRDAAAFGLCFQLQRTADPALAERCLKAGERIFALADTGHKGRLLTAIPYDFYPEREWRDDLELGATELAIALEDARPGSLPDGLRHREPSFYLGEAARWAREYLEKAKGRSDTLNLYDVSGLADYELVRAMRAAEDPAGLDESETQLIAALGAELEGAAAQSARDPFGFGFPWAEADTASHGDGLAAMAAEYDWLTSSQLYASDEVDWLGNVLGANAWGVSMIIGDGSNWVRCPSQQVANLVGSHDGSAPVLAGAVVEGPSNERSSGLVEGMRECPAGWGDGGYGRFDGSGAVFSDDAQSYTTTEPAIDLTASSLLAFGWGAAGAPAPLG